MLLTDAGQYAPGTARQRRWTRFAGQCAAAGVRPLVFAPVPPRRGGRLTRPLVRSPAVGPGCPAPAAAPPCRSGGRQKTPRRLSRPAVAELLAALARASRVEPPLLRDLRLALAERGADVGSEFEVWHHAGVRANILACSLAPSEPGAPPSWRLPHAAEQGDRSVAQGNRHQSPLVRAEEALAAAPRGDHQGRETARRLAATLHRGQPGPQPGTGGLRRAVHCWPGPDPPGPEPELAVSWGLANREALRAGAVKVFPPGVDLATLEWLWADRTGPPGVYLGQEGAGLSVFPVTAARPACRLAEVAPGADYWQIDPAADPAGSAAQPQVAEDRRILVAAAGCRRRCG